MPKSISKFVCQQCGYESTGWLGRCPGCGTWNSLVETILAGQKQDRRSSSKEKIKPQALSEIKSIFNKRLSTKITEFDRVLGGGIVPGSVTLLAGEPGIGKSTLLLQMVANLALNKTVVYVSGEESAGQVKIRAERLGISAKSASNVFFLSETEVDRVIEVLTDLGQTGAKGPQLLIIDSIQTMWTSDLSGTAGSVGQVRECAARLLNFAKSFEIPTFFIGHVNKEGAIAGPMALSHLVDTVLFFEGERYQSLRILRGIKNRFGPTDEVGVFSMEEKGLMEVRNPSVLFLSAGREETSGSVVCALMEGSRPLLIEIQALVVPTQLAIPRRVSAGVDLNRLQLLVAVLSRRAGIPLGSFDVFVNVVGGIKVSERGADLAICLAIASAWADKSIDPKVCILGEVGLLGEVRLVGQLEKRLKEARRLGFTKSVTPQTTKTLQEAIKLLISK